MRFCFVLCTLVLAAGHTFAADANPAEQKLRESLRNTMLQMRTLQGERDTLQADKEALEAEKKELAKKFDDLKTESEGNQAAAEKTIATVRDRVAKVDLENAQQNEVNKKLTASLKEATELSAKREAARAKLNSEKIELQRVVSDQLQKNREMFKLGNEILSRYEGFGLGTAITAREPFVGVTKVKLQNLVQDYGDKLSDQRIRAGAPPVAPSPASAPAPAATPNPTSAPRKLDPPSQKPVQNAKRATVTG